MVEALESWIEKLAGRFVVFDGPDGSGKSTQFRRFAAAARSAGLSVCEVREPGGTEVGESIRKVLLEYQDHEHGQMDLHCEMLLFMASRAQLIHQRLAPALARGELVLADRFISSTLAYQGTAGGLAVEDICEVGRIALGRYWPDLVVIFDVDPQTASARLSPLLGQTQAHAPTTSTKSNTNDAADTAQSAATQGSAANLDRLESRGAEFHRKVRQGFLDQASGSPATHLVIDACAKPEAVYSRLLGGLAEKTRTWT